MQDPVPSSPASPRTVRTALYALVQVRGRARTDRHRDECQGWGGILRTPARGSTEEGAKAVAEATMAAIRTDRSIAEIESQGIPVRERCAGDGAIGFLSRESDVTRRFDMI
jgi:hypothetical protein